MTYIENIFKKLVDGGCWPVIRQGGPGFSELEEGGKKHLFVRY